MFRKKKKEAVALLWGSSYTEEPGYLDKKVFEFWSCNNLYRNYPEIEFTRWFELHHLNVKDGAWQRRFTDKFGSQTVDEYLDELNILNIPIYTQKKISRIPKSIEYPLLDVLQRFPRAYFNNSFAYMIALAILEGFKEINIYGLSYPNEDFKEYYVHRMSTEYLLGIAEGLGIKVYIPLESDLLKTRILYAYQEQPGAYELYRNVKEDTRFSAMSLKNKFQIS